MVSFRAYLETLIEKIFISVSTTSFRSVQKTMCYIVKNDKSKLDEIVN